MDTSRSIYDLVRQVSRRMLVTENAAIRLFNSVTTSAASIQQTESLMSICSSNELGESCRICRWNQTELQIQSCPCQCKGSVGYVHFKCLRRWILHRGDNHCEICGTRFDLSLEKRSYKQMFWSFFQSKYFGAILKNCAHIVTIAPISYLVLYQVLLIMDNIQLEEHHAMTIVFLAPALLLTSSTGGTFLY